jgi:hypothetical protein
MSDKPQKPVKVSYASRSAIGSLFKAVTLSTDPAHTLGFTSSLVNSSRSSLIYKLEQHIPDEDALPSIFNAILKMTACGWKNGRIIDEEAMGILNQRIDTMFPSISLMRYDLETYRDILFCDDLSNRWKEANITYLQDARAWGFSNEQLADINRQLMEIITRHDLMEFPKGESFNLDEHGTDVGAIAAAMAASKRGSR